MISLSLTVLRAPGCCRCGRVPLLLLPRHRFCCERSRLGRSACERLLTPHGARLPDALVVLAYAACAALAYRAALLSRCSIATGANGFAEPGSPATALGDLLGFTLPAALLPVAKTPLWCGGMPHASAAALSTTTSWVASSSVPCAAAPRPTPLARSSLKKPCPSLSQPPLAQPVASVTPAALILTSRLRFAPCRTQASRLPHLPGPGQELPQRRRHRRHRKPGGARRLHDAGGGRLGGAGGRIRKRERTRCAGAASAVAASSSKTS